jgi:predicted nucleotidyltransferase
VTSPAFKDKLQSFLGAGTTYAAAYEKALQALANDAKLNSPNDILALEYCKALQDTNICPLFIKREQANYNDTTINGAIASATAIRKACVENNLTAAQSAVPESVAQALAGNYGVNEALLWKLICYRLRLLTPAQIAEQCQCTEGLENLLKQAENCSSLEEAVTMCSKKRYPRTRIRRLFMQLLLGKERSMLEQAEPAYIRVLAFNDVGRQLLKEM